MYCNKKCLKSCKRLIWSASIFILHYVTLDQISNDCCNLIKRRTIKVICEQANFFLKKFSTWYGIHNLYKQHTSRGRISLAATRNRPTSEFCWTFSGQQEIFLDILLFTHFSLCFKQWLFWEKNNVNIYHFLQHNTRKRIMITNMEEYKCNH